MTMSERLGSWGSGGGSLDQAIRSAAFSFLTEQTRLHGDVLPRDPLAHSKKGWNGHHARRALLEGVGIFVPRVLSGPAGRAAVDDVLDAAAAAWTAWRRSRGLACRVPTGDPDPDGGFIWY